MLLLSNPYFLFPTATPKLGFRLKAEEKETNFSFFCLLTSAYRLQPNYSLSSSALSLFFGDPSPFWEENPYFLISSPLWGEGEGEGGRQGRGDYWEISISILGEGHQGHYIDIVNDEQGRPGFKGIRSLPVFIENIPKRPGYYWVDFRFPERVRLSKGRHWIVLRHSGEVIMNWFYIPGNPYGDPDDTRSTLKGYKWEDIQNFDFVFKIRARR